MQDSVGFYAPLPYSPAWFLVGVILVLLVAFWLVRVLRPTRMRNTGPKARQAQLVAPPSDVPLGASLDSAELRRRYLFRIDAVAANAAAGRIPARAAHQELSLLVRSFARDATGTDATRMTLQELEAAGLTELAEAVACIYPAAFSQGTGAAVRDSVRTARKAVAEWS
ncbi:hypothetical protein [Arthrobacter sp. ISL-30]|uniref:hypothetical protein n=1 Tax=Arthrobacter sp. ISL-30 TaxID=2819109 RepID=UPI001BE66B9A|nr:hypothetical protein [Arthrobacter sp. ISL-30]MBT2513547.1 hypothetical protein [Arthrobacter sp. ISL-30]